MPDEQQISDSVHSQLRSKRSAIAKLPDAKQDAIYSLTFERFLKPRLTKGGLTNEQLEQAKASYIKGLKGQSAPPINFESKHEETVLEGAGGIFAGVGAGIAGAVSEGTRATSELLSGSRQLTGLGEALVKPIEKFAKKGKEAAEYGSGKTYAKVADVVGKTIPGLVGAEAALPALETLTGSAGLTTLVEGAATAGSPGAKVAKAAAAGSGFDLGSGDNTSGRRAVQYAAFDFLSRPIGRLIAKTGGKYATAVLDYVGSAMDSRRSVGKTEAVTVGKEAAEKAESKLVTKLAELFPNKAERVKKGESLETVYTPEDVTKALSESRPKKTPKVAKPNVEVQPEQTTPAQKEKELEVEGKRVVAAHPATQETIGVVEQLSGNPTTVAKPTVAQGASNVATVKPVIGEKPFAEFNAEARKMQSGTGSYTERARPEPGVFDYKIDWERYKDKGAEGVHLARSNAQHEVSIQAAEAANTIKSSPTLSAEEKQKALQALGDKAKHTLYKIKTEKVPEGFVSAKTRDAARKATEFATATATKSKEATESLQRNIATSAEDPAIKLIEDSRELESQYKAKGRTAFYNQITKAWTKQGHGDIGKLNEMLKIGLEKVESIKPQESPKILGDFVNPETGMISGSAFKKRPLQDWPESVLPPHVEKLGSKLGITKYFLGAEMDRAAGLNVSHEWYQLAIKAFEGRAGLTKMGAEVAANDLLIDTLKSVKNISDGQRKEIFDATKKGEAFVFLSPEVKGKGTAIHETMHSLTGKELGKELLGKPVELSMLQQLLQDTHENQNRDFGDLLPNLNWIRRRHEYFTELMTQYFMGHVKTGSQSEKIAEAILKNSKDPEIQKLVGSSLGVVVAYGLSKKALKKNGVRE